MTQKVAKYHSLSRRIVILFCLFTLVLSVLYGVVSFMLMYTLEDRFIEKHLKEEADYMRAAYQQTGVWPESREATMTLHFSKETFPLDMRDTALTEPRRVEFFGQNGRHYHLYTFNDHNSVFLLAEVSKNLVVRQITSGVIKFLVLFAVPITIVACLIAWLLGRKTTRPLKQLADLVDGVDPENIPDTFAHQFPNNEVGILAKTLENSLQRMAEALTREKYFTRDVSHELRTPLAVIKNALELLQNDNKSEQAKKQIIGRITQASEQMEMAVNTLLMLAREENGSANSETIALMPIIERAVLDNRILLDKKDIEIDISDRCDTTISGHAGMLKVLLDNILSNAFQYTESGEVRLDFVDGSLHVSDTGPGIAESISDKIMESGVKGSQSLGYGFGLSIVKRLCQQQGWQLSVTSGTGTKVSVKLGAVSV